MTHALTATLLTATLLTATLFMQAGESTYGPRGDNVAEYSGGWNYGEPDATCPPFAYAEPLEHIPRIKLYKS